MRKKIQTSAVAGSVITRSRRGSTSRASANSGSPSNDSKLLWEMPKDLMGFTSQAAQVANALLNGTLEIEKGRVYASIARVVSQSVTAQVQAARLAKSMPDLRFLPESTK